MKLLPFTAVDGLAFGATAEAVADFLGPPSSNKLSRKGERELSYANARYRFDGKGHLTEVTADTLAVQFGSVSVPFKLLAAYLKEQDLSTFEKVGFVVSPMYGLALDPAFPSWVTAFSTERLALWRAIGTQ